jgi:hypothetical protein
VAGVPPDRPHDEWLYYKAPYCATPAWPGRRCSPPKRPTTVQEAHAEAAGAAPTGPVSPAAPWVVAGLEILAWTGVEHLLLSADLARWTEAFDLADLVADRVLGLTVTSLPRSLPAQRAHHRLRDRHVHTFLLPDRSHVPEIQTAPAAHLIPPGTPPGAALEAITRRLDTDPVSRGPHAYVDELPELS